MSNKLTSSNASVANALVPIIDAWGYRDVIAITLEILERRELAHASEPDTDEFDKVFAEREAKFAKALADLIAAKFDAHEYNATF